MLTKLRQRLAAWRAERKAAAPERIQRRAAAKAQRLEHRRVDPGQGGGGG
jgi:hypothetical protein